ncbi:unnamed protein product [Ilex paraguariensis]|uniref:Legumain prodomain domain-containing protein n=1 Tax=Ilex paraguariensis TaxID=185542 RepID=A0ABC8TWA0_9AQUA
MQVDVCHAYQLLKRGGLKDENIVVFMYDDIAWSLFNSRPGVLINHPNGPDIYAGVPKDYTGKDVTAKNIYAVLLGNKSAIKSGSGKVVDSKPHDRISEHYSVRRPLYVDLKRRSVTLFILVLFTTVMVFAVGMLCSLSKGDDRAGSQNRLDHVLHAGVRQRDAVFHYLWFRYKNSKDGSEKTKVIKEIRDTMMRRKYFDGSVDIIALFLFGPGKSRSILKSEPVMNHTDCLPSMVQVFETHSGVPDEDGLIHTREFAIFCNKGISQAALEKACIAACSGYDKGQRDPSIRGY